MLNGSPTYMYVYERPMYMYLEGFRENYPQQIFVLTFMTRKTVYIYMYMYTVCVCVWCNNQLFQLK